MALKKFASAAVIGAAVSISAVAQNVGAPEPQTGYRYQGWGLAISYEAIGKKCEGALTAEQLGIVQAFVAAGLSDSKAKDSAFDPDKFARDFRAEMMARYSQPANCTPSIIENARASVAAIAELESRPR